MMRALFVTRHLRVGGAQRNWTILLPGLAERGFEVFLLTLEAEGELFEELGARGTRVACARMRTRLDVRALRRAFELGSWQPDLVVSHDERSHLVARRLAHRTRAAHVAADHGGPGFRLKLHRELILRLVAPGFAATVTVAERRVPDLLRRGFRGDRVHVIENGVDAAALRPARSRDVLRSELALPSEAFVVLLLAVLRAEKRADRFVRSVARANADEPRIRGVVAGYGPEEGKIRRLAAESGGAVMVLGHRSDVADLINAADAVCLTSELEGGPYAALEAMALSRPVVAMRAGALDEVVLDGETGVLVPQADEQALAGALVALACDPVRAEALGVAGSERQRARFDAGRMCDAYAALFRTLATARSSTPMRAGSAAATE
jgi:glycosyltransferase involved in cell wall biosynthesis